MRMRMFRPLAALFFAAIVVACGGDESDDAATDATTTSVESTTVAPTTSEDTTTTTTSSTTTVPVDLGPTHPLSGEPIGEEEPADHPAVVVKISNNNCLLYTSDAADE